ncbi:hypothetical protein Tco_0568029, partial [Tanacetum coccineum]
ETPETSGDDFWKNHKDWEIVRWRLNEPSGVHTLELEDGTMIHMLAERRYPLSRELMIRMLEHGMEVEDENETAITLIHLYQRTDSPKSKWYLGRLIKNPFAVAAEDMLLRSTNLFDAKTKIFEEMFMFKIRGFSSDSQKIVYKGYCSKDEA